MVVVGCFISNSCNVWDFSLSGSRSFLEVNVSSLSWPGNSAGDLIVMVKKWPFERLLEQEKVTLNRLVPVLLWELLPRKLTCHLKRDHLQKEISSCQPSFFRVHVKHFWVHGFPAFPRWDTWIFRVFFPFPHLNVSNNSSGGGRDSLKANLCRLWPVWDSTLGKEQLRMIRFFLGKCLFKRKRTIKGYIYIYVM